VAEVIRIWVMRLPWCLRGRVAFPALSRELSARQSRRAFPHVQALQLRLIASLEIRQMRFNGTAQLAIETIVFGGNGFVAYLRPRRQPIAFMSHKKNLLVS